MKPERNNKDNFRRGNREGYRRPEPREEVEENENQLEGRNALTEALRSGRTIDKVFIAAGNTDRALEHLAAEAKKAGAVVVPVDRRKLDAMSTTRSHQGVIALAAAREYCSIDDILQEAADRGEVPLIIICDELSDPHNLGAILRTAECSGAHGVIIPKRRSAGLTAIVAKTSAGAVSHLPVARVPNLVSLLKELKEQGLWIGACDMDGTEYYEAKLTGPIGLVVGGEGQGVSRLVREHCDFILSIPMVGKISSLNASNAAAILMYETFRQRAGK